MRRDFNAHFDIGGRREDFVPTSRRSCVVARYGGSSGLHRVRNGATPEQDNRGEQRTTKHARGAYAGLPGHPSPPARSDRGSLAAMKKKLTAILEFAAATAVLGTAVLAHASPAGLQSVETPMQGGDTSAGCPGTTSAGCPGTGTSAGCPGTGTSAGCPGTGTSAGCPATGTSAGCPGTTSAGCPGATSAGCPGTTSAGCPGTTGSGGGMGGGTDGGGSSGSDTGSTSDDDSSGCSVGGNGTGAAGLALMLVAGAGRRRRRR